MKTPWLIVGVLAIALVLGFGNYMHRMGELDGRIAHLTAESKRVDTVYRRDTLTLTKVRRRTDSILVTDTLWRSDTVRVLIAAERNACNAAIRTCEQRIAIADSTIKALRKKPSVWSKLPWVAAGVLGGVILSK
jgi:hypothetical protein